MYINQEQGMPFTEVVGLLADETQGEIRHIARQALQAAGAECELNGNGCEDPVACISKTSYADMPGVMVARQAMLDVLKPTV